MNISIGHEIKNKSLRRLLVFCLLLSTTCFSETILSDLLYFQFNFYVDFIVFSMIVRNIPLILLIRKNSTHILPLTSPIIIIILFLPMILHYPWPHNGYMSLPYTWYSFILCIKVLFLLLLTFGLWLCLYIWPFEMFWCLFIISILIIDLHLWLFDVYNFYLFLVSASTLYLYFFSTCYYAFVLYLPSTYDLSISFFDTTYLTSAFDLSLSLNLSSKSDFILASAFTWF